MIGCNECLFNELKPTLGLVVYGHTDLLIREETKLITRKLVAILLKWQKVRAD
jgi:hypothetical protein